MPRAIAVIRLSLRLAVTVCAAALISPTYAFAADGSYGGVPPGTFEVDVPAGAVAIDGSASDTQYRAALLELQSGRFDAAQRQFEMFVAASPSSPLAADARRHLSELYNRPLDAVIAPDPVALSAAPAQPRPAATPARAAPGAAVRRAPLPPPVSAAVENSFIAEAGDRIFFAAGSADLGARARAVIAAQARWLKKRSELQAVIEGHADDAPLTPGQHDQLSAARAEAVSNRLIEEGISRDRLAMAPWGRDKPVAICTGTDCAAQNRRVVTVLTPHAQIGGFGAGVGGVPYASGGTAPAR